MHGRSRLCCIFLFHFQQKQAIIWRRGNIVWIIKVQNKIHYAVHGETAAEVIYHRADAEKNFMGLMSFSVEKDYLETIKQLDDLSKK